MCALVTGRPALILEPVRLEWAMALVAGDPADLRPLVAGRGWPHRDTLDGLRMATEYGAPLGWFIVLDGVVVGDCGIHSPVDPDGAVEISYSIAAPFRGLGLATEAVMALTDRLFEHEGVRRVVASTHASANPASRRVLTKCGFGFDSFDGTWAWYSRWASGAAELDGHQLGDLRSVQRGALAEVVPAEEQVQ
jgi:RimJ/RimL family protein N-acetyltransferase